MSRPFRYALLPFFAAVLDASAADQTVEALLDKTVWVDIGVGRRVEQLAPKERAALQACREPSMMFAVNGAAVGQTFFAGLSMKADYPRSALVYDKGDAVVFLYRQNDVPAKPAETIRISRSGNVLVQWSAHFQPHTFLRCSSKPNPLRSN